MKKFKKLGSILLAAVMALSLSVPAFAADITTDNSAGTVPVIVTTPEGGDLLFKVTLPTSFDIAVDKNGAVKTTDGLKVTTAVTSSDRMFSGCYSLVGGNSTAFDSTHTDKEYARIDAAGTPGYFTDVNALPVSAVLYDNGELVFQKGSAPMMPRFLARTALRAA